MDIDAELINTQSDIFRIECFATLHDVQKIATAIVETQKMKTPASGFARC
ncbi:MAG: hypothetical protein R2874_09680 [Desulfobacterales bacterium]